MSKTEQGLSFEEALEKTDFGFIVCGVTGRLKGLWIPEGMEDEAVPEPIVKICKQYFDIDPNSEDDEPTFH